MLNIMANKYNNHSQVAKEDLNDRQLVAIQKIQKNPLQLPLQLPQLSPQQHITSSSDIYPPTPYFSANFQNIVLKSTLNPNAKEFFPSYMKMPLRNGCKNPINYVLRFSSPDYKYQLWSNCDYENGSPRVKCLQESVQRSNTVLPLVIDNNSSNCSTAFDNETINSSDTHEAQNNANNMLEGPTVSGSEVLKTGDKVWFIEKRVEPNQSNEDNCKEWTTVQVYKEEKCDDHPQISEWTDGTSTDIVNDKKLNSEEDKEQHEKDSMSDNKRLVMLFPTKKQIEIIQESSQESIFEEPKPISYTSDESCLAQSNPHRCYNVEMDQVIKKGKQFYVNNGKNPCDVLDELQDLSEDLERTAKPSDSKSYELVECDTSKSALVSKPEKPLLTHRMIPRLQKYKFEKIQKIPNTEVSAKDVKPHKFLTYGKESKANRVISTTISSKDESATQHKFQRSGFTVPKTTTGVENASKTSEMVAKTTAQTSTTGAIPKTKESAIRSFRKGNTNNEPVNKSVRTAPKSYLIKKEAKDSEIKNHRPSNEIGVLRTQVTANVRRTGTTTNHTETKSIGKPETLQKKTAPGLTSRSRSVERKSINIKPSDGMAPLTSKPLTHYPSTNANSPAKKAMPFKPFTKERVAKSVVKSQMRSSTEFHPPSPTKKIIVANNAPNKEKESKKSKVNTTGRNDIEKPTKIIASTKIPVRQKSTALNQGKPVVGSDGDNAKIQVSKSCGGRKILSERTSRSSTQIGDKLSRNKKEFKHLIPSRENADAPTRNTSLKREALALN